MILNCSNCSGNVPSKKSPSKRICDIDGDELTSDYQNRIKEFGCSYQTYLGSKRKTTIHRIHLREQDEPTRIEVKA